MILKKILFLALPVFGLVLPPFLTHISFPVPLHVLSLRPSRVEFLGVGASLTSLCDKSFLSSLSLRSHRDEIAFLSVFLIPSFLSVMQGISTLLPPTQIVTVREAEDQPLLGTDSGPRSQPCTYM